jgi:hypothetical protein
MAFPDTIFRWLGNARATVASALATYAPGDTSELASDLHGRLLIAVSDAGQLGSAIWAENVLASDSTTYPVAAWKGISVNTSGIVKLRVFDPTTATQGPPVIISMAAGVIYPLWIYQVYATGTDAALLGAGQITLYK